MRSFAHRSKPCIILILVLILVTGANQIALAAPVETGAARPLAYTGCGGSTAPVLNPAYEAELVERVNAERAKHNLPPLKRVDLLDRAARYHGTDLGQDNYFDHDTFDGNGGTSFVCECGTRISKYYANYSSMAENIAAGYDTPADVMDVWLKSQGHRDNILSSSVWEIGAGYYQGSGNFGKYWVLDFGRRVNEYPMVINGEAVSTFSRSVNLYIYGAWTHVRVRINGGAWSGWLPFQNPMNWTLPDASGTYTIDVELKNGATTAAATDKILLQHLEDYPGVAFLPLLSR